MTKKTFSKRKTQWIRNFLKINLYRHNIYKNRGLKCECCGVGEDLHLNINDTAYLCTECKELTKENTHD